MWLSHEKELKKCYQNRKMIAESAIRIEIFYHILSSLYISEVLGAVP